MTTDQEVEDDQEYLSPIRMSMTLKEEDEATTVKMKTKTKPTRQARVAQLRAPSDEERPAASTSDTRHKASTAASRWRTLTVLYTLLSSDSEAATQPKSARIEPTTTLTHTACPDCGRTFSCKTGLGLHRRNWHFDKYNAKIVVRRVKLRWSKEGDGRSQASTSWGEVPK